MIFLAAILGVLLVGALIVAALSAVVALAILTVIFGAFKLAIALLTGDPYLGFACAIPSTLALVMVWAYFDERSNEPK